MENATMITVFGKKKTTKQGKEFMTYFTKRGETFYNCSFVKECTPPTELPCNIDLERGKCFFKEETVTGDDGREFQKKTIFVKEWKYSDTPYVDESADFLFDE